MHQHREKEGEGDRVKYSVLVASRASVIGAASWLFAACASALAPTERLVGAQAAPRAAEEVGASQYPRAEYHAQLAREQLDRARKLIADGDQARADIILQRATVDAEVALAVAREGAAKQAATAATGKAGQ